MAKKQSNIGIFERAGYALGGSKARTTGTDYVKGISGAIQDISKMDKGIAKTEDLLKKNPKGVKIPKLTEAQSTQVSNWLKEKKPLIVEAHNKLKNGTDEEKQEATEFLNSIDRGVQQLNEDFEGAATQQQSFLQMEADGNYATANTDEQRTNFHNIANGTYAERGGEIIDDENGIPRLHYDGVAWDKIDAGSEYSYELQDTLDAELRATRKLAHGKNPITDEIWNNQERSDLEDRLNKLSRGQAGRDAIKNYMYETPRLMDAFISNQVGIPQKLKNGEVNPVWDDFKAGIGNKMPRIGDVDPVEKIPQYDDFFKSNKVNIDFSDGFVETILGYHDAEFANREPITTENVTKPETQTDKNRRLKEKERAEIAKSVSEQISSGATALGNANAANAYIDDNGDWNLQKGGTLVQQISRYNPNVNQMLVNHLTGTIDKYGAPEVQGFGQGWTGGTTMQANFPKTEIKSRIEE